MSDVARKIFPLDNVLALVLAKEDVDVKDVAGFLVGRSLACDCCSRVVAPLAAGYLASLYPAFVGLEWDSAKPWDDFVAEQKKTHGDNVSIPPMNAVFQNLAGKVLDALADMDDTITAQKTEIASLNARVAELEPQDAKAKDLEKKCDQLEGKVKTMTTDMNGLRKQLLPFNGKMAVDQQELMTMIKDTIKANMKGFVAAGAAGAAGAEVMEDVAVEEEREPGATVKPPDDFGFGASGDDSSGFGF